MADLFAFWLRAFVCVSGARACCVCEVGGNMWAEICGRKCGRDRGRCSLLMCVHDWCLRLLVYSFLMLLTFIYIYISF